MSRISTLGANNSIVTQILEVQDRLFELEQQVASEKASLDYAGIADDSERLINVENINSQLQTYISNNQIENLRLNLTTTTLDGIKEVMDDFQKELRTFGQNNRTDETNVATMQDFAFRSLQTMEALLNSEADGRYLYSGSAVRTQPVDLGLSSLANFQAKYDGATVTYPTTRDAHLENLSFSADDTNTNAPYIDTSNFLRFTQDSDGDTTTAGSGTIYATSALFSNMTVGATITVADTASNDGTYTVESVSTDGQTITVKTEMLTDETVSAALTDEAAGATIDVIGEGETTAAPSVDDSTTISFDAAAGTITTTTVGDFSSFTVGEFITISGSGSNDGTYKVAARDATDSILTIEPLPTAITLADGTIVQNDDTGDLTFSRSGDTITAATAGAFSNAAAGETITVAGTDENDGTYTIASVSTDGTTVTIEPKKLTNEGSGSGTTFFDTYTNTDVELDATNRTITVVRAGTSTAIPDIFNGLAVGDQITLAGATTAANDATYTISAISSDGSQVTVSESIDTTETDADGLTITGSGNDFAYTSSTRIEWTDATNTIEIQNSGGTGTIAGVFSHLTVGEQITFTGTTYDDTYTIASIAADGSSITVNDPNGTITADATDTAEARIQVFAADGSVSATSYFKGDTVATTHRVDDLRNFENDITAIAPAFEKAIRAMAIMAQGQFGTEGGLDQNTGRAEDAMYLITSALQQTVGGDPPFGTELSGSIESLEQTVGFNQVVISRATQLHKNFSAFLEGRASDIENVDPLDTITKLLDDQRALEASFQTFSRLRQLSLTNFI
jgi:flagellar hook-associated protein 3 FlgL